MTRCNYCGTIILFGGERTPEGRYCSACCVHGALAQVAGAYIPDEVITREVAALHKGPCPKCGRLGPIDVHTAYFVWSVLLMTGWSNSPDLSCRACARSRQLLALLGSALLGWWGFPWGPIMTPVQVVRNLVALAAGPDPRRPSPRLDRAARAMLGAKVSVALREDQG